MPKQKSPPIPGMVHTTLYMPEELHANMQAVRQARRVAERKGISLWQIYREAVEYYLAAKPQRELLKAYSEMQAAEPALETKEEPSEELYAGQ